MRLEAGGLAVRLLPERGLDLGELWLDGAQLAWLSGAGFDSGEWGGGLLRTCGLENVGAPSEGFPLHGHVHFTAADVVEQRPHRARAIVQDGPFRLERELELADGVLSLRDVTENLSDDRKQAPLLYHVNLGPALWSEGGELTVRGHRETIPRDDDARAGLATWALPPETRPAPERVFEHLFEPEGEWGEARLRNSGAGHEVTVRWRAAELPRLHQWVNPTPGIEAFALEPANCSVLGRAADREEGRAPWLAPGERRETILQIGARRL